MDKTEQIAIIQSIGKNLTDEILLDLRSGKIPTDWTGIQLRQLFIDRLQEGAHTMPRKMKNAYRKDVLVRRL